jgi:hypothetical protein
VPNRLHAHAGSIKALHERYSKLSGTHVTEYLVRGGIELKDSVEKQEKLANIVDRPNPLHTPAHQFERVSVYKERLQEAAKDMINEMGAHLEAGRSFLTVLANNRLKLTTETKYQPLILDKYKSQGAAEIFAVMNTATKEGDWETFAAIINAPTSLTGLTGEQKQRLHSEYVAIHAPDIAADFKVLADALEITLNIDRSIQMSADEVSDPRRLMELRAGIQAAEDAEKAFGDPPPKPDDSGGGE